MAAMDEMIAELRGLLERATALPWAYRPEEYDDWGTIRSLVLEGAYMPVVASARGGNGDDHAEHRLAGTDPFGPNAELITAAVNALPTLLDALTTSRDRERELEVALEHVYEVGFKDARAYAASLIRSEPEPASASNLAAAILEMPIPDSGRS